MIYERMQKQIKEAMLTKNTDLRDVLKQVQMKVQAYVKENKVEIADEVVFDSIRKELKQLNQTKTALGGKTDCSLYKSTNYKISVLEGYLPKQLSREECMVEVKSALSGLSEDMPKGAKIGTVMKSLKGKADNKLIKECLDSLL